MTVFARQYRIGMCVLGLAVLMAACSSTDNVDLQAGADNAAQAAAAADRAAKAADRAAAAAQRAESAAAAAAEAAEKSNRIAQQGLRKQ